MMNQRCGNARSKNSPYRATHGDKSEEPFTLLGCEQVGHESPKDGGREKIEDADPDKEASINPRLLSRRHVLHQREENNQIQNEKPISDRNKSPPRHPRDDGGKERVRDDHRHQNNGEHPPKILDLLRADVIADRPDHIIAGEDEKKKNNPEPHRAKLVRANIDNEKAFHRQTTS